MSLKTDYKNYVPSEDMGGKRRYRQVDNPDGTVSFDDATTYEVEGNKFGADDINQTNSVVNTIMGAGVEVTYEESTVKITASTGATMITFIAPSSFSASDKYTINGKSVTITDLNGNPVKNGWKQGAPVTLSISGSTAYFAAGPQASLQTVKTTTSWAKKSTSAGTQYWEQPVTVPGLTAQAQVDIALDADGLNRLLTDGVSALWAENNMGNLTVKTLEAAPTAALTLYLTITEVSV